MEDKVLDKNLSSGNESFNFDEKCEQLISDGYSFDMRAYISRGYEIFKQNIGPYIGFTFIYFSISGVLSFIPVLGPLTSMVISPALGAGFFIVARKISKGEAFEFGDFLVDSITCFNYSWVLL